jgi:hypothetical protein
LSLCIIETILDRRQLIFKFCHFQFCFAGLIKRVEHFLLAWRLFPSSTTLAGIKNTSQSFRQPGGGGEVKQTGGFWGKMQKALAGS